MNRLPIIFILIWTLAVSPLNVYGTVSLPVSSDTLQKEDSFPLGAVSFADSVVFYDPGAMGEGTGDEPALKFQRPEFALGMPDYNSLKDTGYVSLGKGGTLVLKFTDNVLIDGPGPDVRIFLADTEDVFVWISKSGDIFIPVGEVSNKNSSIDIHSYAEPGAVYSYIKLRDDPNQGEDKGPSLGADIDAVGAINAGIKIIIPSDKLFEDRTARFNSDTLSILSGVAEKIRILKHTQVLISAYTDNRGTEDFNMFLSQEQAYAVKNYFMDVENLTDVNYIVIGWGDTKPVASNDSDEGRKRNRRVEILIRAE